jgi:hypothetical protein
MELDRNSILKQLGYFKEKSDISREVETIIDEEIHNSKSLLIPRKILKICKIEFPDDTSLKICGNFLIYSKSLQMRLYDCVYVYIFAATVGDLITKKMTEYIQKGEFTRAIVVDSIGSVAVESFAETVNQEINQLCSKSGYSTTKRFSPGFGDWSIVDQKPFLDLIDAKKIGININENYQMLPEKSISAVIGVKSK